MTEDTACACSLTIGKKHSLNSTILGEDRPYWVYLPASYDGDAYTPLRYPVIYLLDGDAYFPTATGIIGFLSATANGNLQMPECIVIAIPNTDRIRDLTPTHSTKGEDGKEKAWLEVSGGGNSFLQFMKDELFPEIESQYRTLPYRLLVGHSLGGLLALHALLSVPAMFQAYLAIDPSVWWDAEMLTRIAESTLAKGQTLNGNVYISLASSADTAIPNAKVLEQMLRKFTAEMTSFSTSTFRLTFQDFEAEDHGTVVLPSLHQGFLALFRNYRPIPAETLEQPESLRAHFARLTDQLGTELKPPPDFVSMIGFLLLYELKQVEKALEAFNLNVKNYPDSFQVYVDVAEAYVYADNQPLAIANYQKSLFLNSSNQSVIDKLAKLTNAEKS